MMSIRLRIRFDGRQVFNIDATVPVRVVHEQGHVVAWLTWGDRAPTSVPLHDVAKLVRVLTAKVR
jgi:hypothetical protein